MSEHTTAAGLARVYDEMATGLSLADVLSAEGTEELPIEDVARLLVQVRAIVEGLLRIEAIYERWTGEIFKDQGWETGYQKPHHVEGVGDVEVTYSRTTTWDSEALTKAWLEKWMEDRGAEVPSEWDLINALGRAIGLIKADGAYGSVSWRITPLKALGIDPDEYKTTGPWSAPKVKVVPGGSDG